MDRETRKTIIEIVFILMLVILGAVGGNYQWYAFLFIVAGAFMAYFTIMCTRCQTKMAQIENTLGAKYTQIRGLQDYFEGNINILNIEQIIEIERKAEEDIWIATYDLSYDLGPFLETVTSSPAFMPGLPP